MIRNNVWRLVKLKNIPISLDRHDDFLSFVSILFHWNRMGQSTEEILSDPQATFDIFSSRSEIVEKTTIVEKEIFLKWQAFKQVEHSSTMGKKKRKMTMLKNRQSWKSNQMKWVKGSLLAFITPWIVSFSS